MDVTCQRCQTRYEFDDALVSSRGTTVKCTQCGNLFRVHPPEGARAQDSWTIRTKAGAELRFRAMRELQAAITSGRLGRDDVLLSGPGEPRRLGDIEELGTFFVDREPGEPDTVRRPGKGGTRLGVTAPTPRAGRTDRDGHPLPSRTGSTLRPPAGNVSEESMPFEVVPGRGLVVPQGRKPPPHAADDVDEPSTDEHTTRRTRSEPPRHAIAPSPPSDSSARETARRPVPEPLPSSSTGEAVAAMAQALSEALADDDAAPAQRAGQPPLADDETYDEDPRQLASASSHDSVEQTLSNPPSDGSTVSSLPLTPSPSVGRPSILGRASAFTDPRFSSFDSPGRRPSFARWLIGLLVLGVVVVGGFTLVRRFVPAGAAPTARSEQDERVDKFLRDGRERLAAGDVEGAREQFIKASGVAETDPRVAQALALVEVIRADQLWLHLKLLDGSDPERVALERLLEQAVDKADRATERAGKLASHDPASVRLRVDVLRLKGDQAAARSLVGQLGEPHPEDAVTLAALDLDEKDPSWPSVIDRLQNAARNEQKLGRARGMLVYAYARAGQWENAANEITGFRAALPTYPLLDPLERFVERAGGGEDAESGDGGAAEARSDDAGAVEGTSDEAIPSDFREAIRKAHAARQAGELERAEQLYHSALDKSPGNSEALAGLAEVYRARGSTSQAMAAYQSLLDANPAYLPALVGLADLKWQSGARGEAVRLYRQVIDAAPGSAYADHARQRIEANGASSTATASPPPTSVSTATATAAATTTGPAAPPPESTGEPGPHIDTSDLPEFH